jgi:hypothetical protein
MDGIGLVVVLPACWWLVLGERKGIEQEGRAGADGGEEKRRSRAATAGARGAGRQTRRHGIGRVFRSLPVHRGKGRGGYL